MASTRKNRKIHSDNDSLQFWSPESETMTFGSAPYGPFDASSVSSLFYQAEYREPEDFYLNYDHYNFRGPEKI